jgi:hypothetical protein
MKVKRAEAEAIMRRRGPRKKQDTTAADSQQPAAPVAFSNNDANNAMAQAARWRTS